MPIEMTAAIAVLLGFSDIVLAMCIFVVLARPRIASNWLRRYRSDRDLDMLEKPESDDSWLASRRTRMLLLVVLFLWSFVCGVFVTWLRL